MFSLCDFKKGLIIFIYIINLMVDFK